MSTGPDFPPLSPAEVRPFTKLADVLTFTAILLGVTASCLVILGFTGHETPRKLNVTELAVAVVVYMQAGGMLAAARSLRRAMAGGGDVAALVGAATGLLNMLVSLMCFIGLATLGALAVTVQFLIQVVNKNSG